MPQMKPSLWMMTLILTSSITMMMMINNFFSNKPNPKLKMKKKMNQKKTKWH